MTLKTPFLIDKGHSVAHNQNRLPLQTLPKTQRGPIYKIMGPLWVFGGVSNGNLLWFWPELCPGSSRKGVWYVILQNKRLILVDNTQKNSKIRHFFRYKALFGKQYLKKTAKLGYFFQAQCFFWLAIPKNGKIRPLVQGQGSFWYKALFCWQYLKNSKIRLIF